MCVWFPLPVDGAKAISLALVAEVDRDMWCPPQACNSDLPTLMTRPYGLACAIMTLKAELRVLTLVEWMARSSAKDGGWQWGLETELFPKS